MTKEQAIENLRTARDVIRETSARLASLQASDAGARDVAELADRLRHAVEVRAVSTILLLRYQAEAEAAELIALDARRRELWASLASFQRTEFLIGGELRRPFDSCAISGALMLAGENLELADPHPALRAADERWHARFGAIVSEEKEVFDARK